MWIIQWNKADLGSYPHKVVRFPSSSASFSTSNVSSFQVGWFYKYRDVSWRSQQSNWSQLIPRHQILEKSVTWIVICSLFFLAICSSSALTTIRLNICNNHCIFNTFVLIPSTPDSQAFSLPEKKKDCSQLLSAKIACCCTEFSKSASHLPPGRKRPFKMCDIIWGEAPLLSWMNIMAIVDEYNGNLDGMLKTQSSKFY